MSLITQARSAFVYAKRIAPQAVVIVQYKDKTCSALRVSQQEDTAQTMAGNKSTASGSIKVDRSELDRPVVGEIIKISGLESFVGSVTPDVIGAFFVVNYQGTKPYTGEAV